MSAMKLLFVLLLLVSLVSCSGPFKQQQQQEQQQQHCKCLQGEACFPKRSQMKLFNSSIGGRLLRPHPAAFSCHDPHYDEQACNFTTIMWSHSLWRSDQVGALQYSQYESHGNKSCLILSGRSAPCFQGSVPSYAVNVSSAEDVQATVNFARSNNLKLVVKNTGHDFFGRSTARGAISLWMHNLKTIQFFEYMSPCNSSQQVRVAKIGAGVQWGEVNAAATKEGAVFVGALSASVGASGGWWQGAGHGNLAPTYGLGADNVVEFELVTADGKLLVANQCQNQDLFWAMRGGGGGTFGVVLSATHLAHPAPSSILSLTMEFTAKDTSSFEKLLTELARIHPSLTDAGWSGTFATEPQNLVLRYIALNKEEVFVHETFQPLYEYMSKHDGISISSQFIDSYATYEDWYNDALCSFFPSNKQLKCADRTGLQRAIGSRLIPRSELENSPRSIGAMLAKVTGLSGGIFAMSVAGGAVSLPRNNAVNPAWRKAIWHIVIAVDWKENASRQERDLGAKFLTNTTQIMVDATPGSGAYFNEGDYNSPDWQRTFFGENYEPLLAVKRQRDPTELFICRHCVGSEQWDEQLKCRL